MDENKDFVIDAGAPVTVPAPEDHPEDAQVMEDPVSAEGTVPEEPAAETAAETPEPEPDEAPAPEPEPEPELEPESEADVPSQEETVTTLVDIAALIRGLEKKFDDKIAVDEHKNGLFDKLYKERDEYKNDLYGSLLKPFINGCIEIITDLRNYIGKMDTYDVERSLNYLRTLPDDLIELLEDNGVEVYSEEGDTFNPRTQRAKKTVPTEDASLNNTVAERIENGYRWNGVVLRPEMVAVYRAK